MILHPESWMNIRRFRALHEAGASYAEIAAEVGCDWRTVKKYLSAGSPAVPPAGTSRKGTQPRKIAPFTGLIDSWLRAGVTLRASVICERLTAGYGYDGSYQRVKLYVAEARPKIAAELAKEDENSLAGLHRRFEVAAGAQAQVDWGEESGVLIGTPKVYSFHMTLSYSRDPFCCYTARTDLATFFGCHIRAFEYFGGVPGSVVYDRTKTVVRRHVAPGKDRKSTRLNSSHEWISYAVFCLKKKTGDEIIGLCLKHHCNHVKQLRIYLFRGHSPVVSLFLIWTAARIVRFVSSLFFF